MRGWVSATLGWFVALLWATTAGAATWHVVLLTANVVLSAINGWLDRSER